MIARGPERDAPPPEAIAVSLFAEQRIEDPAPQLRSPEVAMPEVFVPPVSIDIRLDAPPPPINVVAVSTPPKQPAPQPQPVSKGDTAEPIMATSVEYLRPPVVSYPAVAKQARAAGTAQIRAVVETDGRVREVSVERSSGHASLDKAAKESVRGALFRPYMHNGIAHAALVIVPVEFSLKIRGGRHDKGGPPDACGNPHRRDREDDACDMQRGGSLPQALDQSNTPYP
jgi:protein TonB